MTLNISTMESEQNPDIEMEKSGKLNSQNILSI